MGGITTRSLLRKRWPFGAATIVATAAIATALFFVLGHSGGGPASADKVLAEAVDAEQHPETVGLQSYHGVVEVSANVSPSTHALPTDVVNLDDDPSIVQAEIPLEPTPEAKESAQFWYQAPNKYRFEVTTAVKGQEPQTSRTIIDNGQTTWYYVDASNRYATGPSKSAASIQDTRFLFAPGAFINNIGDVLTALQTEQAIHAVLSGSDKILGRDAYVVKITQPATTSEGNSDTTPQEIPGGVIRLWLDKQYLVLLRFQVDSQTGGSYDIRFSNVEFNTGVEDRLFQFSPPPGAFQVDQPHLLAASGGGGSLGSSGDLGQHVEVPSDVLAPTYFLTGYQARSVDTSYHDSGTYKVQLLIRQDNGSGYISAEERRDVGDLPAALKKGTAVSISGHDAWLSKQGSLLHLAWQQGDLVIYMISRGLTESELEQVAASTQPGTAPPHTAASQPISTLQE